MRINVEENFWGSIRVAEEKRITSNNAIVLAQSTFSGFSPYGIMVLVLDHANVLVLITVLVCVRA